MKQQPKLPQYFVIKKDESNPLWKKYVDWMYETYKYKWSYTWKYLGFDGGKVGSCGADIVCDFSGAPTLITLEYWNECVNGEKEAFDKLNEIWGDDEDGKYEELYNKTKDFDIPDRSDRELKEMITGKSMKQRKIIGYKTPCDYSHFKTIKGNVFIKSGNVNLYHNGDCFLPSEIVETWEPVYEEEKLEIIDHWFDESENICGIFFKGGKLTQEHIDKIKGVI